MRDRAFNSIEDRLLHVRRERDLAMGERKAALELARDALELARNFYAGSGEFNELRKRFEKLTHS